MLSSSSQGSMSTHLQLRLENFWILTVLMISYKENIDPGEEKAEIQTSIIQSHGLVGVGDISLTSVAK